MQQETLCIQDTIKDKELYEDFQCHICYSIALKPAQCCGPCHKRFCTKCVSDWKVMQDRCPLKCSEKSFFVKTVQAPSVNFGCPFNPSMCPTVFSQIQKFQEHYQCCQFISTTQKKQKQLKHEGKCFKEHKLEFFLGTYEEMCESTCSSCKEVKLCRSICRKCNQLYCVFCRPPKCSQKSCPLGHKFNYQQWTQIGYICDLCGISTSITNKGVYDDALCNFGLCQGCYQNLPDQCELNQTKTKSPYHCSQGHELMVELPQQEMRKCFNCEKTKYCPKVCNICDQVYCVDCRIGIICEAKMCYNGHELIKCQTNVVNGNKCIKCMSQSQTYYQDSECKFSICELCFEYENRILDNKNRFIEPINCARGHQLKFYSGQSECIQLCFGCKKNSVIKLFCDYCSPGERTYCCNCKPIKLQSNKKLCYFGHGLQFWKSNELLHCNKCGDNKKDFYKCFKCNYFICHWCYANGEKEVCCGN